MNDMFVSMAINLLLTWLDSTIKNTASRKRWERAVYKVYTAIALAFPQFADGPPDSVVAAAEEKLQQLKSLQQPQSE